MIIRPLRMDDAQQLQRNCFSELPLDEVVERVNEDMALQELHQGVTLVAEADEVVGVHAKMLKRGDRGWIFNVSAHPAFRGRGVVQKMLDELAGRALEMGIERLCIHVREDNLRARRAYEKAGFHLAGQDGMHGAQLRYERKIAGEDDEPAD